MSVDDKQSKIYQRLVQMVMFFLYSFEIYRCMKTKGLITMSKSIKGKYRATLACKINVRSHLDNDDKGERELINYKQKNDSARKYV